MEINLESISIKNFKNLKDVKICPGKFNVIVGPNGSGKSSFIEFFKLIKRLYVEKQPYPFIDWDGYENIVWNHNTKLPIRFEIQYHMRIDLYEISKKIFGRNVDRYKNINKYILKKFYFNMRITYSTELRSSNIDTPLFLERLLILEIEELKLKICFKLEGENVVTSINDEKYVEISKLLTKNEDNFLSKWSVHQFRNEMLNILSNPFDSEVHLFLPDASINLNNKNLKKNIAFWLSKVESMSKRQNDSLKRYIFNLITRSNFFSYFLTVPFEKFGDILILFPINIKEIKYKPKIFPKQEPIRESGENVLDVLSQIQFKNRRLPESIDYFVDNYFGGKIYFQGTAPGRLNLYYSNGYVEVSKENLPDGLIKGITILTALEQRPHMLFIDEIENSLHPELIEFIVKELKEEGNIVFISTHSPVVLNMVDPENIFIFKCENDLGVVIKRVSDYKSKKELMEELDNLGISLGDKVLYGLM